ncbi:MAG: hypothetical protein U0234_25350 [Sandaracinus sp.]
MVAIGMIVLVVGLLALAGGGLSKLRAGRIANTPFASTGDVASKGASIATPKGGISTQGRVVAPQLATSPVTGTPCLYYEVAVTASWKVGDQMQTHRVTDEKIAAPFAVDDGSGAIRVDCSKGGDLGQKTTFQKKQSRGLMSAFTGKPLTFGDRGFSVPQGIRVGLTVIPDHAEFEVVERCVTMPEQLYVNGKLDNGAIGSPNWTSLVFSTKSRDDLLAGTATMAQRLLLGGGVASAAGAVIAGIGAMMG